MTTIIAALTDSTSLMIVTLTLALVTADVLAGLGSDVDPSRVIFTFTFLIGAIMFIFKRGRRSG